MKSLFLLCLTILVFSAVPNAQAVETSVKTTTRHGQSAMTRQRVAKTNEESSVSITEPAQPPRAQLRKDLAVDSLEKTSKITERHGQAVMSRKRNSE